MANEWPNILSQRAFHPTDPPHGMRNYDLGSLSHKQKENLSRMKIAQRKQNEIYLDRHPEIRGIISILLRYMLIKKPSSDLHEIIGNFFSRSRNVIAKELLEYLLEIECTHTIIDDLRKEVKERNVSESSDCMTIDDIHLNTENVNDFNCKRK